MNDDRPEWDGQPSNLCIVCMTERDDEGKCKCPPQPSLEEQLRQMVQVTNDEEED